MQPLVIAYHLIWTAYGWWLPNDPRGSGSQVIRSDLLKLLGELHHGRKKIQPANSIVREFYAQAEPLLKFPRRAFDAAATACIADAFATVLSQMKYTCYACAIMPDHVHLVIRKHKYLAEEMIQHLQQASAAALCRNGLFEADHPVWTRGSGWKVFLDSPEEIWRTIDYVNENPLHISQPRQNWPWVTAYDNWPLHEGHNPNSPYARRLRGQP
jgi:REP element-mobilizing transposase RayT